MARYFFDIHDGARMQRDGLGTEYATIEKAHKHAKHLLPEIALDELPRDGDRIAYTVLVRDEHGHAIYSATLSFAGLELG